MRHHSSKSVGFTVPQYVCCTLIVGLSSEGEGHKVDREPPGEEVV